MKITAPECGRCNGQRCKSTGLLLSGSTALLGAEDTTPRASQIPVLCF